MSQPNIKAEIAQAIEDGFVEQDGEWVKNPHAQALRAIPSEKRKQASRLNGKKGGRPKKNDKTL